ncbi:hypothetical protein P8452_15091 [Trifolium repens]|nr:hypothetical protein P8452_15091 [Trifolium repens]
MQNGPKWYHGVRVRVGVRPRRLLGGALETTRSQVTQQNDPVAVITKFESQPSLHTNPSAFSEYVKALVKLDRPDQSQFLLNSFQRGLGMNEGVQPIVESNTTFKDVKGAYLRDLECFDVHQIIAIAAMETFRRDSVKQLGGSVTNESIISFFRRNPSLYTTAIHESGHAIVGYYDVHYPNPTRISIVPSSNYLGVTVFEGSATRGRSDMVIYLAGRAAERHVLGDDYTTSGVVGDLIGANEIAIKMSEEMLDLELLASGPISEKLASAVEEKALSLLADATGEAERVVKTYESSLLTLTEAVLMTGNLCQPEIHKILKHVEMYGPLSLKAIQFLLKKM